MQWFWLIVLFQGRPAHTNLLLCQTYEFLHNLHSIKNITCPASIIHTNQYTVMIPTLSIFQVPISPHIVCICDLCQPLAKVGLEPWTIRLLVSVILECYCVHARTPFIKQTTIFQIFAIKLFWKKDLISNVVYDVVIPFPCRHTGHCISGYPTHHIPCRQTGHCLNGYPTHPIQCRHTGHCQSGYPTHHIHHRHTGHCQSGYPTHPIHHRHTELVTT